MSARDFVKTGVKTSGFCICLMEEKQTCSICKKTLKGVRNKKKTSDIPLLYSDLLYEVMTALNDLKDKIVDVVFWTYFYVFVFSVC